MREIFMLLGILITLAALIVVTLTFGVVAIAVMLVIGFLLWLGQLAGYVKHWVLPQRDPLRRRRAVRRTGL